VLKNNGESRALSTLRQVLPWTSALVVIAALWTGWVFFSRYEDSREVERQAEQKQANADREILDKLGGDKLTILDFYASPAAIHRGTHASLCYGVSNAKSVTIDPGLGEWRPALSRCIDITPSRTTTYTLTARNAKGASATETASVVVR